MANKKSKEAPRSEAVSSFESRVQECYAKLKQYGQIYQIKITHPEVLSIIPSTKFPRQLDALDINLVDPQRQQIKAKLKEQLNKYDNCTWLGRLFRRIFTQRDIEDRRILWQYLEAKDNLLLIESVIKGTDPMFKAEQAEIQNNLKRPKKQESARLLSQTEQLKQELKIEDLIPCKEKLKKAFTLANETLIGAPEQRLNQSDFTVEIDRIFNEFKVCYDQILQEHPRFKMLLNSDYNEYLVELNKTLVVAKAAQAQRLSFLWKVLYENIKNGVDSALSLLKEKILSREIATLEAFESAYFLRAKNIFENEERHVRDYKATALEQQVRDDYKKEKDRLEHGKVALVELLKNPSSSNEGCDNNAESTPEVSLSPLDIQDELKAKKKEVKEFFIEIRNKLSKAKSVAEFEIEKNKIKKDVSNFYKGMVLNHHTDKKDDPTQHAKAKELFVNLQPLISEAKNIVNSFTYHQFEYQARALNAIINDEGHLVQEDDLSDRDIEDMDESEFPPQWRKLFILTKELIRRDKEYDAKEREYYAKEREDYVKEMEYYAKDKEDYKEIEKRLAQSQQSLEKLKQDMIDSDQRMHDEQEKINQQMKNEIEALQQMVDERVKAKSKQDQKTPEDNKFLNYVSPGESIAVAAPNTVLFPPNAIKEELEKSSKPSIQDPETYIAPQMNPQ